MQFVKPGTRLIWAAACGLAVLAAATFYVSFRAQFTFMFAVTHQDLPALIEALIADVAMVVCSLLALGMACAGQSAKVARLLVVVFAGRSGPPQRRRPPAPGRQGHHGEQTHGHDQRRGRPPVGEQVAH